MAEIQKQKEEQKKQAASTDIPLPGQMEIRNNGEVTEIELYSNDGKINYGIAEEEKKKGRLEERKEPISEDLYTPIFEVSKEEIKQDRRISTNMDLFPYNLKGIKRFILAKSDRGEKVKQWQIVNKAIEEYLSREFKKL